MATPKTLKNNVNPLNFNVPITDGSGKPTDEFQRKWLQQARTNANIPDLTTAAKVSAYLDLIGGTPGMLLERGATAWGGLASPNDATKFLNGAAFPAYALVKDSDLSLSDITTNNATTARHGFVPKLPNDATKFYDGTGAFTTPAGGGGGAASIQDDGTTVFMALSDADGQLVLDGLGRPIFSAEVFSPASLPLASSSAFGAVKVDNSTIQAIAGVIATKPVALFVTLNVDQAVTNGVETVILFNIIGIDTLGSYAAGTGRFTPTKAGTWFFFTGSRGAVVTTMGFYQSRLRKNGAANSIANAASLTQFPNLSAAAYNFTVIAMNGTTDYIDITGNVNGTGGTDTITGSGQAFFGGFFLGT